MRRTASGSRTRATSSALRRRTRKDRSTARAMSPTTIAPMRMATTTSTVLIRAWETALERAAAVCAVSSARTAFSVSSISLMTVS